MTTASRPLAGSAVGTGALVRSAAAAGREDGTCRGRRQHAARGAAGRRVRDGETGIEDLKPAVRSVQRMQVRVDERARRLARVQRRPGRQRGAENPLLLSHVRPDQPRPRARFRRGRERSRVGARVRTAIDRCHAGSRRTRARWGSRRTSSRSSRSPSGSSCARTTSGRASSRSRTASRFSRRLRARSPRASHRVR